MLFDAVERFQITIGKVLRLFIQFICIYTNISLYLDTFIIHQPRFQVSDNISFVPSAFAIFLSIDDVLTL